MVIAPQPARSSAAWPMPHSAEPQIRRFAARCVWQVASQRAQQQQQLSGSVLQQLPSSVMRSSAQQLHVCQLAPCSVVQELQSGGRSRVQQA